MTLIVTDANGRKYRPTGQFREPQLDEFLYCFDHKGVEQRKTYINGTSSWCSNAHPEFLLHRIIVAPVPVEYEVTVRMPENVFKSLRERETPGACSSEIMLLKAVKVGNYAEVQP